ncbi:hypothetical protein [Labrenzia sp. PHM005]|uniref:hypothetical protein n=1 Tax=Labrenzia sp. PHM005 TaxID=2590016 RepID=UPI001AD8D590|nr:hypothetical protein [Labrenzia sp. PHM005]
MRIPKTVFAAGLVFACSAQSQAQEATPKIGDTHIISRDDHRVFRGSHRIYNRKADGLVEVTYCNRSYWVRYATVAWTQLEVDRGNEVRVEFNRGKGWRPICAHPEEQVTLADLGIHEDPRIIVQEDGPTESRINRFAAISKSFSPTGNTSGKSSYHASD